MKISMKRFIKLAQIALVVVIFLAISCQEKGSEVITKEEAKAIFDSFLKFRNEGDLASADAVMHPECVILYPNLPEKLVGLEAYKEYDKNMRIAFPDFKLTIDDFFVKDDKIFSYWSITATNTGTLKGLMGELPPTNKKIHISGFAISHIVDGKIKQDVAYFDMLRLLQQLGFQITPPKSESQ